MSSIVPDVLGRFHKAFLAIPQRRNSFTLSTLADENANPKLKKLLGAVSGEVYSRYKKHMALVKTMNFASFLMERCTDLSDALSTPEYKHAKDEKSRRQAIEKWMGEIATLERTQTISSMSSAKVTKQDIVSKTEPNPSIDFYSKYSEKDESKVSIVKHNVTHKEDTIRGIVVQPPVLKPQKHDNVDIDNCLDLISKGKINSIPRKNIEGLCSQIAGSAKTEQHVNAYKTLVDYAHEGFDSHNLDQIKNAMTDAFQHGLGALPTKERRSLVDLMTRGSTDVLENLSTQAPEAFAFIKKNASKLQEMADKDVLKFGNSIANIIEKTSKGEPQAFVLGHNEVPILRILLNRQDDEKLSRYMQLKKLKNFEVKDDCECDFERDQGFTWSTKKTMSAPFISGSGKTKIYASLPCSDDTSFFRKWARDCGCCDSNQVFLAPTDECLIGQKILEKASKWSKEQLKAFVESHQVKPSNAFSGKVKKMAQGEVGWISNYRMKSGKDCKALLKTNVFLDKTTDSVFIPVGQTFA